MVSNFDFKLNSIFLFYKPKKNNYYLTVTNFYGEVLISCSGGQLLKEAQKSRNKKTRRTTYSFFLAAKKISSFLRRSQRTSIDFLMKPHNLTNYHVSRLLTLFKRNGMPIKSVKVLLNLPHSKPNKTKKIRRL